ncbi:MAG: hypothetical protein EBR79_03210 [Proteobacteria bacterium]|nr:hypothetical protein [Pseudomonadota bacterium]NBX85738.1 hypothetical protein [Pseudomonadota bacterium]
MFLRFLILTSLAFLVSLSHVFAEELRGRVVEVYDGDTFVLATGEKVRLLDVNTPEVGHRGRIDEPLAQAARGFTVGMISGSEVRVVLGAKRMDKYKRYLGQVYLPDGQWLNGELVRTGLAHVYSFADNADRVVDLLPLERLARLEKLGLWSTTRWGVREALDCCPAEDIGRFMVVQGVVKNVVETKERWHFNFGVRPTGPNTTPNPDNLEPWQRDFSFYIGKRDLKWFKRAGIDNVAGMYQGRHVLVRGFLEPVNGVLVRVTHPAQIELLAQVSGTVPLGQPLRQLRKF